MVDNYCLKHICQPMHVHTYMYQSVYVDQLHNVHNVCCRSYSKCIILSCVASGSKLYVTNSTYIFSQFSCTLFNELDRTIAMLHND